MIALLLAVGLVSVPTRATGCEPIRVEGKLSRSRASIRDFRKAHPCPATGKTAGACPGFVVDHIWPLCAGGCDAAVNMQWQPLGESRAKDALERFLCGVEKNATAIAKARCELHVAACTKGDR